MGISNTQITIIAILALCLLLSSSVGMGVGLYYYLKSSTTQTPNFPPISNTDTGPSGGSSGGSTGGPFGTAESGPTGSVGSESGGPTGATGVTGASTGGTGTTGATGATGAASGTNVLAYKNTNYGNPAGSYTIGDYPDLGKSAHIIQSLKIPPGYEVNLYKGKNFQGLKWIYKIDQPSLGKANKAGSSMKVCKGTSSSTGCP